MRDVFLASSLSIASLVSFEAFAEPNASRDCERVAVSIARHLAKVNDRDIKQRVENVELTFTDGDKEVFRVFLVDRTGHPDGDMAVQVVTMRNGGPDCYVSEMRLYW